MKKGFVTQRAKKETYKKCDVCGKRFFDRSEYERNTSVLRNNPAYPEGNMPDEEDPSHYFELRNCFCGATLCVRIPTKRDLSQIGFLRRELFDEITDYYADKYDLTRVEAKKTVYEKYRDVFRSHLANS